MGGAPGQRPLSELSPMAQRTNSPSWNQSNKGITTDESSPFNSSPFNPSASPRLFWQGRESGSPYRVSTENRSPYEGDSGVSASKRSSIENLKRASRVKNSSMFAREHRQEYDPAHVQVLDRPLATGRPLSMQFQNKLSSEGGVDGRSTPNGNSPTKRFSNASPSFGKTNGRLGNGVSPLSPRKEQISPTKSSLSSGRFSSKSLAFDPESEIWSDEEDSQRLPEGHSMHRHGKSVTFDAAPPQINEYEMTTPDPSSIASGSREGSYDSGEEDEESFDRSFDIEDSFDASLEDTDKTPVVLPEDWRFMSPASANDELVQGEEDPFNGEYGTASPDSHPTPKPDASYLRSPVDSPDSNGERRPLPPLPPSDIKPFSPTRSDSGEKRSLPSPPRPASYSKADINGLGNGSMSLDDRLRLMMIQEREKSPSDAERQRERRMRRAGAKEKATDRESQQGDSNPASPGSQQNGEVASFEVSSPPRISRESILRNIKNRNPSQDEPLSPTQESSPPRPLMYDPDVPIPSLEDDDPVDIEESIIIKEEDEDDDGPGLDSIPDYLPEGVQSHPSLSGSERDLADQDNESSYSRPDAENERDEISQLRESGSQSTPVPHMASMAQHEDEQATNVNHRISGSEFSHFLGDHSFDLDFRQSDIHGRSSTIHQEAVDASSFDMSEIRESLQRPSTPDAQRGPSSYEDHEDEPSTPESVIRHPIEDDMADEEEPSDVPEPIATIKAPGAGLKTRPSLTPADAKAMAATRRTISGQQPAVPPIPAEHMDDGSQSPTEESDSGYPNEMTRNGSHETADKRQSSLVKLDIPVGAQDEGLSFGLDREFDRVIESQKVAFELSLSRHYNPAPAHDYTQGSRPNRDPTETKYTAEELPTDALGSIADRSPMRQRGYLMRHNTKYIVASSRQDETETAPAEAGPDPRDTKSAGNSPRKASQQTWTTEPWNGKTRRQSIKMAGGMPKKRPVGGPVPPLPGQQSNAKEASMDSVDDAFNAENDMPEDEGERGRLFVKVVGVKELDLPLPRGQRSYFALTLDNGLHCVTTSWLELGKSAPIGQEFELVVMNELEFQLTLQMKIEDPPKPQVTQSSAASPTKSAKTQKSSAFSRVFASPKKRKELEMRQQMEAEKQQKTANASTAPVDPYASLRNLVARDGTFARSYVSLGDHEQSAFGRPYTVDVACFNEWAIDETMQSVKSKKSSNSNLLGVQKRPPYQVGNLELQLLYVPRPKGAKDDAMPKSMNACVRELREAENTAARTWEGFLSQQGGDCPYWRRRFFKLQGSKLTAYHESTRQPRATINLAKASKLIDDKSTLTQKETSGKGGKRRKSAFAEEEEGYMFVEEGFRIRFGNGEVIDFYADSGVEKDGWMEVLSQTVGKGYAAGSGQVKGWTELVLRREKSLAAKLGADRSRAPLPPMPRKEVQSMAPPPPPMNQAPPAPHNAARHRPHASQSDIGNSQEARRQKTRSMVF
ncbi:Bud site selection protein bud4 [Arachnomyces sp. PD_36]|nr:Bud site selection protein bud4 [Arachnomyces sp. PD_36]